MKMSLHDLEGYGYYIYSKLTHGKLTLQNGTEMDWKHGFVVIKKIKVPEITVSYDSQFQF